MDNCIRIHIMNFYDDYSLIAGMLTSSPTGLLKEMTQDFNDIINHTMSAIINNSHSISTPEVLGNSLRYVVSSYSEAGGIIDQSTAMALRKELGKLAESYMLSLSNNFGWCVHHLVPLDGFVVGEGSDSVLTLVVKYGVRKVDLVSGPEQEMAISPDVQLAISLMIGRL